jgi:uracil-DNA glycosylase
MLDTDQMSDARAVANMLRWWQEAGVDALVDEAPRHWTAQRNAVASHAPVAAVSTALPATLDALIAWLAQTDDPAIAAPPAHRLEPFGTPGSKIMIITDVPEPGDAQGGTLLSGDTGRLFDRMLSAIGLDRTQIYCAALSPGRPDTGRIDDAVLPRLAEIMRHHMHLAAPKRVWLLGQATSRAILGIDEVAARGRTHLINHEGSIMDAVASMHPRLLLQNPRRKAGIWADMQLLIGGLVA